MTKGTSFFTGGAVALALAMPMAAQAQQERKSPLADAPAVRRRVELRDKRFEIGVGGGTSVGQDFYHAIVVNGRLAFHLTDWLAIAGWGAFNLTPNFKTSFHEKLTTSLPATLPPMEMRDRTPSQSQATDGMNRIGEAFAGQLEIIPFTGKFGLFSKLFMNYDFYAFGGVGVIDFKSDGACGDGTCPDTGFKIGPNFGLGMHLFANDFFALNFELRDIMVKHNPAGRDTNGDLDDAMKPIVDDRDKSWDSNFMMSLNLMFFLPGRAAISD